jgi:hypothetical protein
MNPINIDAEASKIIVASKRRNRVSRMVFQRLLAKGAPNDD